MSRAPSCGVVGAGAEALAWRAVRRGGGRGAAPALLVRWGTARAKASLRLMPPPKALRAAAAEAARALPEVAQVSVQGAAIAVDLPGDATLGAALGAFLVDYPGPVAVAIGLPRCDAVDDVLRALDEVVLIGAAPPGLTAMAEQELAAVVPRVAVVPPPRSPFAALLGGESGQTLVVAVAVIAALMAIAVGFGVVASALGRAADAQGRADVAALAGARALLDAQPLVHSPDPAQRITPAEYRARGLAAARHTAEANGLTLRDIRLLGEPDLPTQIQIRVTVAGPRAKRDRRRQLRAVAEVAVAALAPASSTGDYTGPLAVRQGQRMRPDVALAFDRMAAAARAEGHALTITSAFRSDAEQAALFARNPDPKWVAPPGKSLHRLGTELDLGPSSAWGWLAANCKRFGFLKRYSWEAWHFGYTRSAGSTSLGYREGGGSGGDRKAAGTAIPSFVPAAYAPMISRAAQRWSVGAALLGAQLWQESKFNPRAVSPAGAAGIAQFMPGTAATYGLSPAERFDPAKAIMAQAHHMHDLLRQFGSVPLALAAYNAGAGNVSKCMCIPPFPETQGYVQSILAKLGGAGVAAPAGLQIRLVA